MIPVETQIQAVEDAARAERIAAQDIRDSMAEESLARASALEAAAKTLRSALGFPHAVESKVATGDISCRHQKSHSINCGGGGS